MSGIFHPAGPPSIVADTPGKSDNQFWGVTALMAWEGGISGVGTYVGYLHLESGVIVTTNDVSTLAAVVDRKSGTLTIRGGLAPSDEGHWVIISGTGDLVNLHR